MDFSLPVQARVHKVIPKSKFFEKTAVSTKLRREFVDKIQKIVWEYKLSPETIGIPATIEVEEIQIFKLELKERVIPKNILRLIDKVIPYPILYVLSYEDESAYAITLKVKGEQRLYCSAWNEDLTFYFNQTNLERLYQGLVTAFIAKKPTESQDFATIVLTDKEREGLEREIVLLKNKLRKEPQFNRKVEINTKLQLAQQRLKALTNPA